jgi:predicted PurR-regulated permease PerM
MLFGLTIPEFIGIVLSLLTSAVALILVIVKAGRKDLISESVEHLLGPMNEEIKELKEEIQKKERNFSEYKARVARWKKRVDNRIARLIKDLEEMRELSPEE